MKAREALIEAMEVLLSDPGVADVAEDGDIERASSAMALAEEEDLEDSAARLRVENAGKETQR